MDREVWFVTGTPPAMPWSGLRQKSWTTSPARHAPMPEAEGEHIRCPVAGCQRRGIPADLGVQLDRRRRHQHALRYEAHRRRLRAATTCWLTRDKDMNGSASPAHSQLPIMYIM